MYFELGRGGVREEIGEGAEGTLSVLGIRPRGSGLKGQW